MGASFYTSKNARAREEGTRWERERDGTFRLPAFIVCESGAVLKFHHFIPRSLNGVPQSLVSWDFMWDRRNDDSVYKVFLSPVFPSDFAVASNCTLAFISSMSKKEVKKS